MITASVLYNDRRIMLRSFTTSGRIERFVAAKNRRGHWRIVHPWEALHAIASVALATARENRAEAASE